VVRGNYVATPIDGRVGLFEAVTAIGR
jgi:hypothetical protein